MNPEKPDALQFRQHLTKLKREFRLDEKRAWWLNYLFHFAHITNAVNILRQGELKCRNLVQSSYADFLDTASPDVIDKTENRWKNYVRFYFRPRTPTLFNSEGFRPANRIEKGAHCPVPIYFLFDFATVICRQDASFSNGNLARTTKEVFSKASDFAQLPFKLIYHDEWFSKEERDKITFHRHAEVMVPQRIDLSNLQEIVCRSTAEYETLCYLLPDDIWRRWRDKISVPTQRQLFYNRWLYIEGVTLTQSEIVFHFHLPNDEKDRGTFNIRIDIEETITWRHYRVDLEKFRFTNKVLSISLDTLSYSEDYTVRVFIDNNLAYANRFQASDIPF